jgi:hypothetical protein
MGENNEFIGNKFPGRCTTRLYIGLKVATC